MDECWLQACSETARLFIPPSALSIVGYTWAGKYCAVRITHCWIKMIPSFHDSDVSKPGQTLEAECEDPSNCLIYFNKCEWANLQLS